MEEINLFSTTAVLALKKDKQNEPVPKRPEKKRKLNNYVNECIKDDNCLSSVTCVFDNCSLPDKKIKTARSCDLNYLLRDHLITLHRLVVPNLHSRMWQCYVCNHQWPNQDKKNRRAMVNHFIRQHKDFRCDVMPWGLDYYVKKHKILSPKVYVYTIGCLHCTQAFSWEEAEGTIKNKMIQHLEEEHTINCSLNDIDQHTVLTKTIGERDLHKVPYQRKK